MEGRPEEGEGGPEEGEGGPEEGEGGPEEGEGGPEEGEGGPEEGEGGPEEGGQTHKHFTTTHTTTHTHNTKHTQNTTTHTRQHTTQTHTATHTHTDVVFCPEFRLLFCPDVVFFVPRVCFFVPFVCFFVPTTVSLSCPVSVFFLSRYRETPSWLLAKPPPLWGKGVGTKKKNATGQKKTETGKISNRLSGQTKNCIQDKKKTTLGQHKNWRTGKTWVSMDNYVKKA